MVQITRIARIARRVDGCGGLRPDFGKYVEEEKSNDDEAKHVHLNLKQIHYYKLSGLAAQSFVK